MAYANEAKSSLVLPGNAWTTKASVALREHPGGPGATLRWRKGARARDHPTAATAAATSSTPATATAKRLLQQKTSSSSAKNEQQLGSSSLGLAIAKNLD